MKYYYFKTARTESPETWYCYPWSDTILIVTNNSVSRSLSYNSSETWNFTEISETPAAQKLSATLIVKATETKDSKTLLDEFLSFIQLNSKGSSQEMTAKAPNIRAITYIETDSDYELELHSVNNNGGSNHDRFCYVKISAITNVEPVGGKDLKVTLTLTMESLWIEKFELSQDWGNQGYNQSCDDLTISQEISNDGDVPAVLGFEVFGFPKTIKVAETAKQSLVDQRQHVSLAVADSYVSVSSSYSSGNSYEYGDFTNSGTGPVRICSGLYANKEYMVSMVGTHVDPQYKAVLKNAYGLLTFSNDSAKSSIIIPPRTSLMIQLKAEYVGSDNITKTSTYYDVFKATAKLFLYKAYFTE